MSDLRIVLERGGGFAGPAGARTFSLDAAKLSADERAELARAMTSARVDALPERIATPRPMPDRRQLRLTVTSGRGTRTTLIDEPAASEALLDLCEMVERLSAR